MNEEVRDHLKNDSYQQSIYDSVWRLGEVVGYGALKQTAEWCWEDSLKAKGYPSGGSTVTGPCKALVVLCDHNGLPGHKCDWCCGCGWVTQKVKEVMVAELASAKK